MIRASTGDLAYWNKVCAFGEERTAAMLQQLRGPSGNPEYRPQYIYTLVQECYEQMLRRYSRGDDIGELVQYFSPMLDAWEESERLGKEVWSAEIQHSRHTWAVNYDFYIVCFWLVGLGLALEVPEADWQRLMALVGNDGEDALLDRVIAVRTPDRKIGERLCYPKPYARLLEAVLAPQTQQPKLLRKFVENWYTELDRPAKKGQPAATAMYERPYWLKYGNQNFEGGAYFGRWCVEAVAAVKAFGLDDSLCVGLEHYPGDLLRPGGPTTHPQRADVSVQGVEVPVAPTKPGWLRRLLRRG